MSSTAPVKSQSQPLHNFSLPYLKWGKNQASHQRCRKQPPSSQPKNNHHHHGCSASEAESDSGSSHHQDQQYPNNNHNLVIRIPKVGKSEEAEENTGKPWNLRPRRGIMNNNNNNNNGGHGGFEVDDREVVMMNQNQNQNQSHHQNQYQPKSLRLRGLVEGENVEKKDRYKFSIPLSRDEIEEDFFAWTGSKPPRRPKKRNKTVQKHVDNAFPGLWLAGITLDSYDVPELPAKKKKK